MRIRRNLSNERARYMCDYYNSWKKGGKKLKITLTLGERAKASESSTAAVLGLVTRMMAISPSLKKQDHADDVWWTIRRSAARPWFCSCAHPTRSISTPRLIRRIHVQREPASLTLTPCEYCNESRHLNWNDSKEPYPLHNAGQCCLCTSHRIQKQRVDIKKRTWIKNLITKLDVNKKLTIYSREL